MCAFGRSPFLFEPLPPIDPMCVGELVWDSFAASKFAPGVARLAQRGEILEPHQSTVRGKSFIDPQKFVEGLQFHQTLNMVGVERFRPDIRSITTGLEQLFHVPCIANLYVSYAGSTGGYGPHRDQHDVIVVHLCGSKVWRIYQPESLPIPIRKTTVDEEDLRAKFVEFTMGSGSCLYVPAGFVHDVSSREDCCAHLTFGVQCLRWYDLLCDIVIGSRDDVLFGRMPTAEEDAIAEFNTRIYTRLHEIFSEDAVSRMIEHYGFFASLLRRRERVTQAIVSPTSDVDR